MLTAPGFFRRLKIETTSAHFHSAMKRRQSGAGGASARGRGLHSFTSQLDLSAFCGAGCARRDCAALVKGVLRGVRGGVGCVGCFCASDTAQIELKSERV